MLSLQALLEEEQKHSEYKKGRWTSRNDIGLFFAVIVALALFALNLIFGGQLHEDIIPFGILLVIILIIVWIVEIKSTGQKNADYLQASKNVASAMYKVIENWRRQQGKVAGVSFLEMSEADFCETALSHHIANGVNMIDVARKRHPAFLDNLPKNIISAKIEGFQENEASERVSFKDAVGSLAPLAENVSDSKLMFSVYISLIAEDDDILRMQNSLTIALHDGYTKWCETSDGSYVRYLLKFAK
ncbi:MAG: hypothetical protein ABJP89_19620 [Lentilitoribacter sp.]